MPETHPKIEKRRWGAGAGQVPKSQFMDNTSNTMVLAAGGTGAAMTFVIDTNVIIADPDCCVVGFLDSKATRNRLAAKVAAKISAR